MEKIIRYLLDTYHPRSLLVYGSYARGDMDEFSDFDCSWLSVMGKRQLHFFAIPACCHHSTDKGGKLVLPMVF